MGSFSLLVSFLDVNSTTTTTTTKDICIFWVFWIYMAFFQFRLFTLNNTVKLSNLIVINVLQELYKFGSWKNNKKRRFKRRKKCITISPQKCNKLRLKWLKISKKRENCRIIYRAISIFCVHKTFCSQYLFCYFIVFSPYNNDSKTILDCLIYSHFLPSLPPSSLLIGRWGSGRCIVYIFFLINR